MKFIFMLLLFIVSASSWAINCDCEVRVYSPMTGSHQLSTNTLKTYELEEFGSYSPKFQNQCRSLCLTKFEEDMPSERLNALLLAYSQSLINEGALGFNCTGLTTLKYPVRVKASLGKLGLGNVADQVHVINHEELCF